jgi:hypothetical protein
MALSSYEKRDHINQFDPYLVEKIITPKELPPTRTERRAMDLIEEVYKLSNGQGLLLQSKSSSRNVTDKISAITRAGNALGKPVTCRVRFYFDAKKGKEGQGHYRLSVFKRRDVTKRRTGRKSA